MSTMATRGRSHAPEAATVGGVDRRSFAIGSAGLIAAAGAPAAPERSDLPLDANVLRVLFESAETGFDPAQVSDLYSYRVIAHIFEALLGYDPLAMPGAAGAADRRGDARVVGRLTVWTVRLQRGIRFADDPAFKGSPRELVAADYVYAFKRIYDPAWKSPAYSSLDEDGILGLEEIRARALRDKKPFDYDSVAEGLRALDRYTLAVQARQAAAALRVDARRDHVRGGGARGRRGLRRRPRWRIRSAPARIASSRGGAARASSWSGTRPTATCATRASRLPNDAEGQAWAKRFNGRRLPLNDGVEIAVVEENQPRWLSFLNGQADFARVPPELSPLAAPNGKLAPNLAKQGIRLQRYLNPDVAMSYFNMEDPVVGGYTPAKVALRRAVQLAYDIDYEIRIIRRGQAIPAQAPMAPGTYGLRSGLAHGEQPPRRRRARRRCSTSTATSTATATAGASSPTARRSSSSMSSEPEQIYRQYNENWQKSTAAIGVRMVFETAQWPEHMKAARAGKLQMWFLGSTATDPDGQGALEYMYGASIGQTNLARFKLPAFDAHLPAHARSARWPRAPGAVPQGERARRRLHAVSHPRAPHVQRLLAALDHRLPAAVLPQPVVALHRGRRRDAREGAGLRRGAR